MGARATLTHGNLASQLRFNRDALGLREGSRSVLWVPPYHDLGLVSGMLSCLWGNGALWMTSPLDFLRDPGSWFELMHRVRATHTAAPDFAFALSAAKTTPALRADPYPAYAELRARDPVHRSPLGVWVVSRYDDVAAALRDPRLSSDARAWAPPEGRSLGEGHAAPSLLSAWIRRDEGRPAARLVNAMMAFLDRPDHRRVRAVLQPVFSPRATERWRPVARAAVDELLGALAGRGEAELMADFAVPFPVRVIGRMLGVPDGDAPGSNAGPTSSCGRSTRSSTPTPSSPRSAPRPRWWPTSRPWPTHDHTRPRTTS